ncbi:MAG TPA: hypothetical protein VIV63_10030 [Steroidobacteraceae bacterium]
MDVRRYLAIAGALVLGACIHADAAAQAVPPAPVTAAVKPAPAQVDPNSSLSRLYPGAGSIGMAVAIAPDPNVPRYRRLFDLGIHAITLGMLHDGYVLDRYSIPWSAGTGTVGDPDPGAFGIMIFRCDGWREHACRDSATPSSAGIRSKQTTRVRAIYIVTDTATWGVATRPLTCAARRIRAQLSGVEPEENADCVPESPVAARALGPPGKTRAELLQYPGRCESADGRKPLVLFGPNFSGGMDSVGQHVAKILGPGITDVCLVSSTTTNSSNPLVEDAYGHLSYVQLAASDGTKLLRLADVAESFGYFDPSGNTARGTPGNRKYDVAFLTEASTFGYGVCNPWEQKDPAKLARIQDFCRDAYTLHFPAAVADIRYGIEQQRERQQNSVQTAMKAALPSEHLTLDVGAENGSEFPENRQSKLTAASQQLALDHVLEQLEQFAPKMVIVVATDVRDRLFLFDQLRQRLPSAMLIDLETDILLGHPDFLHASRGAVTVASANLFVRRGRLFGCEEINTETKVRKRVPLASWALDGQGILAGAIGRLFDSGQPRTDLPCIHQPELEKKFGARAPILHVVTLKGLRRISSVSDLHPDPDKPYTKSRKLQQTLVDVGQWLSIPCCLVIVLPWLWIGPLRKSDKPVLAHDPWKVTLAAAAAGAIVWTFAMQAAYLGVDPESGFALLYWSVGILSLALAGLFQCLKRVQESGQIVGELPRRHRIAIASVGLFACALAAAPLFSCYRHAKPLPATSDVPPIDVSLMTRLALDIGQGLAFEVVIALGVVVVLAIMVGLATGLCILVRNNQLLEITNGCRALEVGARTPKFSVAPVVGIVLLIAIIAVPSLVPALGGPRLTVFGPTASLMATIVLVATTLGASIFTVVAIHSSRRVRTISAHIGRCVAPPPEPGQTEPPAGEYPGLWRANEWQPDLFATTPVVASVGADIIASLNADQERPWKILINEFLGKCDGGKRSDDGKHRRAIYALLASEISLYRWLVAGAVLCASASVCAAYLFPLEADALLLWNLLVLVVHALLAGYVATAFERDGVLSNILCNRPKEAKFSASLFTYAALPFFALGFAIAVSQVPGVVDWGGGLLVLLGAIGLGP